MTPRLELALSALYEAVMRATIVHDPNISVTGIDELARGLPVTVDSFVKGDPHEQLAPPGSLWMVVTDQVVPEGRVPTAPLNAWLENSETTPDLSIHVLIYALPGPPFSASLLSGFVTQANDLERDLVVHLVVPRAHRTDNEPS